MHLEIEKDRDYTFTWEDFDRGVQQVPSAGTVSIFDNGGATIINEAAVAIDTAGTMSYTFLAADNDDDERNFKARLTYTVGGVSKRRSILFDVVVVVLTNNVRDEDLFAYVGELRDGLKEKVIETTSAGSTTTYVSTELLADQRNWKGGFSQIMIDNTTAHEARNTGYDSDTGTVTFSPAYGSTIASGLTVRVRTSYQAQINRAFEAHVHRDVRNKVGISAGYIDGNVLNNLITFKALEIISLGLMQKEDDKWGQRRKSFAAEYQSELAKLYEPYDLDEDGNVEDVESRERPNFMEIDIER